MKLLLASAAVMLMSAASGATVEKPYELNSEEIGFLANAPCDERGTQKWCTNGWGDFTCKWSNRRGRCREVVPTPNPTPEPTPSPTPDPTTNCDDLNWKGCQGEGECKWKSSNGRGRGRCVDNRSGGGGNTSCDKRGTQKWCTNGWGDFTCKWSNRRGRCMEVKGDDCDGVATRRKEDCKKYCKSGPGHDKRSWGYHWSYDSDSYTCRCDNGRVCKTQRSDGVEDEGDVAEAIGANEFLNADVTELWGSTADEDEDSEDLVIESDHDKIDWDNAKNKTKNAARKTWDGTKEAADKTADATKKAAEKTKDWGKKTFTPDSPASTKSSMLGITSVGFASVLYYAVA